jgi:hypothetical protein
MRQTVKNSRKRHITAVVTILFLVSVSLGCGRAENRTRPTNVPSDAVWAGGPDGGCWVKCNVDEAQNVNHCIAYLDPTGQVMQRGAYRLRAQARAATAAELTYQWCDGTLIGLAKNLVLEPVKVAPEARVK